jgi:hypothetical protein
LVVLSGGGSANEVGVIVRVGREEFTVINNHGIAREARPEELRGKRNTASMRAVALDVQANQIRQGDSVTIVEGPHKGKVATIKRMSRAQLFLYSQFRSEHSGIFVVRSRSCVLTGGAKASRGAGGASSESPFSTPQSQRTAGGGPMRGKSHVLHESYSNPDCRQRTSLIFLSILPKAREMKVSWAKQLESKLDNGKAIWALFLTLLQPTFRLSYTLD